MKATLSTTVKSVLFFVMFTLFTTAAVQAQSTKAGVTQAAIKSLVVGLKSDNEGLRERCIYFAGQYSINETEDALIDAFSSEKNPELKVMIARTLLKFKSEKGMNAVYEAIPDEKDITTKKTLAEIYSQYVSLKSADIAGY